MAPHDHEARRIAQAHVQAGRTDVSRGTAGVLLVAFLLLLGLPPLLHHDLLGFLGWTLPAASHPDSEPFADFALNLPGALLTDGLLVKNRAVQRELRRFEDELDREFHPARALRPHVQSLLLHLRQGNLEALVGADTGSGPWLYFRPDVSYLTGPGFLEPAVLAARRRSTESWQAPPEPDPRPALLQLHRELAERGIDLVLLPTPVKPMLHPEGFAAGAELGVRELQNPSWKHFLADLEAAGVEVLLPWRFDHEQQQIQHPPLSSLRTDTHWTPGSVETTATALAERLAGRVPALRTPRLARADVQTQTGLGDLARMLQLPASQQQIGAETITTRPIVSVDGKPWQSAPDAAVLLLGDSFTNVYSQADLGWGAGAGLAEQLSFELQVPVQRLAVNDGSDLAVRQRLAALPAERFETLRVVVYQFAVRELTTGDWRPVPLPVGGAAAAAETNKTTFTGLEPLRLEARLASAPDLPSPAELPYRDGIVGLVLRDLSTPNAAPSLPEEILLYTWWLRDGNLTAAASWAPGRKLELDIVPWASVAPDLDSYQRVEPDDPEAFLLDAYWTDLPESSP